MKKILIYVLLFTTIHTFAQQIEKSEFGSFLLKNGTLHTITKGSIKGDLLIKNGKIETIENNIVATADAIIIDCTNKHIYPGFIDGGTHLGLNEVGSISLTHDYNELGDFIPHMQALTAVNPNAVAIPVTRTNGITTVLTKPSGGLFPGTAALINLHGYTPEQMYAGFKGVILSFPRSGKDNPWDKRSDEDIKKAKEKALKKLNDIWEKAELYTKIKASGKPLNDYNPQMDALLPVLNGRATLLIEVNKDDDIESALEWVKDKNIKVVFTGVAEGYKVADKIAKAGIPVITGPVLQTPSRKSDKYDAPYSNAAKMLKAGVKVAIQTNDTENVRNLPFNAGYAAAYGMGTEEALKAITLYPAQIFEVDAFYGSLETGKNANLFISDGDPFETKTTIEHLFINGWKIPIESRHTLLYNEFLNRTPTIKSEN